MFHVSHAGRLDAKVVKDKANGDVMLHVMPKSRHVRCADIDNNL